MVLVVRQPLFEGLGNRKFGTSQGSLVTTQHTNPALIITHPEDKNKQESAVIFIFHPELEKKIATKFQINRESTPVQLINLLVVALSSLTVW